MAVLVERGVVNFTEAGAVMVHCPDMALIQIVGAIVEVIGVMRGKSRQHCIDISLGGDERIQRGVVGLSQGISPELASQTHVACESQHSKSIPRLITFGQHPKLHPQAPSLTEWVAKQIQSEWSPDQIAGFTRRVGSIQVSHQWIYNLIYRDKITGGDLWRHCRLPYQRRYQRHLAKRAGLGKIADRVGIECRPKAVDDRLHIGH